MWVAFVASGRLGDNLVKTNFFKILLYKEGKGEEYERGGRGGRRKWL